jgi:serine/threonine protein kinase
MSDNLGSLGGYRLLRVLGEGGMGRVYEAEDPQLNRHVAIKVMRPELADQPQARDRFLREARTMARLTHDHIVPVWHVGGDDRVPFLVMPLLAGQSLEDRLKHGAPPTVGDVLRVGRQTAEALAAAHSAGLVHRDIKPANLWLEERAPDAVDRSDWRVKVLDFGLVRLLEADAAVTPSRGVMGTPGYMAPEQANGALPDARSDLFALGCVLYRMATGQPPFQGKTMAEVLLAVIRTNPTPPVEVNAAVLPTLSDYIMQLLAKSPQDRPRSARFVAEVLRTLEAEGELPTVPLPPPPRRPRRKWTPALAGLAAVAGLAVLVLVLLFIWLRHG